MSLGLAVVVAIAETGLFLVWGAVTVMRLARAERKARGGKSLAEYVQAIGEDIRKHREETCRRIRENGQTTRETILF